MTVGITGATATDIADSVRTLVDRGDLAAGEALPPVRVLAQTLGVNRGGDGGPRARRDTHR